MMVTKLKRRMRCEVQGCHKAAYVGLGIRGNDYPLCKEHLIELVKEGNELLAADGITVIEPTVVEKEVVKEPEPVVEEAPEEYYVCKYCGEKFSKSEMTAAQFMAHCRKCKKEHDKYQEEE